MAYKKKGKRKVKSTYYGKKSKFQMMLKPLRGY